MTDDEGFIIQRGGITIEVIEYGACLRRCLVPDRRGQTVDVAPGFDRAADYRQRGGTMGAVLGRYGNRIGHGRIEIGGRIFHLSRNDGEHTMHGGKGHFGTRHWHGERQGSDAVILTLKSEDGDQGWPGQLRAQVTYSLTDDAALSIEMSAVCDADTYINMIFHGYWNLAGHQSGPVTGHVMKVAADAYTPKGKDGLPTGRLLSVAATPFDFREATAIGRNIDRTGSGYAHNLCLRNHANGRLAPAACLLDPESGRAFALSTDQPGVQVFTANSWSGLSGKDGAAYKAHAAVALETQQFPNTPNTPSFRPRLTRAGAVYSHRMFVRFFALEEDQYASFFSEAI